MSFHEHLIKDHAVKAGSNRSFGLVFAVVFAVIGLLPFLRGGIVHWWAVVAAVFFMVAAAICPDVLAPLNRLWFKFGLLLNKVMEPVIMTILFFVVITPFALAVRMIKGELLPRSFDRDASTYWIDRETGQTDLKRQF
ncbi:MAG: hypothetical protein IEMM0002_1364 [bacterium]|nr:MAG: hypothetical protein IEMM0002_1364 [bacterium]